MVDKQPQPYEAPNVEEVDSEGQPVATAPGATVSPVD
jgi:hypothetical protein